MGTEGIDIGDLNNREIALLVWMGLAFGLPMLIPSVRRAFGEVVRAFLQPPILGCIAGAAAYTAACVAVLASADLWGLPNVKTTMIWFVSFSIVAMMEATRAGESLRRLPVLAKETIAVTALVVFIAETYPFPLWGELLFIPSVVLVSLCAEIAKRKPELARTVPVFTFLRAAFGLGALGYAGWQAASDLPGLVTMDNLREFVVPILLSLMFLPFLFFLTLFVAYQTAAVRVQFAIPDKRLGLYAFVRGMAAFRYDLDRFDRYLRDPRWHDNPTRRTVRDIIAELRLQRRHERSSPPVNPTDGWSPHLAREFLMKVGLRTNDYHRSFEDWWAQSPMVKVGGDIFDDHLSYRIYGTQTAATRLKLVLDVTEPGTPEASEARFYSVGGELIRQALGPDEAETFLLAAVANPLAERNFNGVRIALQHNVWSGNERLRRYERRLLIVHPAHQPPPHETD